MDETSDFDTDFYDSENNGFTVIAEEYLYIDLKKNFVDFFERIKYK